MKTTLPVLMLVVMMLMRLAAAAAARVMMLVVVSMPRLCVNWAVDVVLVLPIASIGSLVVVLVMLVVVLHGAVDKVFFGLVGVVMATGMSTRMSSMVSRVSSVVLTGVMVTARLQAANQIFVLLLSTELIVTTEATATGFDHRLNRRLLLADRHGGDHGDQGQN